MSYNFIKSMKTEISPMTARNGAVSI